MFPTIPTWEAAHPLIVHVPLGLLTVVPLLILAGLVFKRISTGLMVAVLILMIIGTLGIYASLSTGEAAEHATKQTGLAKQVMEEHEDLAELSRNLFTALTVFFAGITLIPVAFKKQLPRYVDIILNAVYLVAYVGALVVLLNTAHQGGRLVHTFGVHAPLSGGTGVEKSGTQNDDHGEKKGHD